MAIGTLSGEGAGTMTTTLYNPETRQYETVEIGSPRYQELRDIAATYDALPKEERAQQSMDSTGVDYQVMDDGRYRVTDPVTGQQQIFSSLYGAGGAYQNALGMTGQLSNPLAMPGMDWLINQYGGRGNNASPFGGGTAMPFWYNNPDGSPGPMTAGGAPPAVGAGVPPGSNPFVPTVNPVQQPNQQPSQQPSQQASQFQLGGRTLADPIQRGWTNHDPMDLLARAIANRGGT